MIEWRKVWSKLKPYSPMICYVIALLLIMWFTYVPCSELNHSYLKEKEYPNHFVPALAGPEENFRLFDNFDNVWIENDNVWIKRGPKNSFVSVENVGIGWHDLKLFKDGRPDLRENALYVPPYPSDNFIWVWTSDTHAPPFGEKYIEMRENVFDLINKMGPAFVIGGGDQTDFSLENEYRNYLEITGELSMPIYNFPGNHETYGDPDLSRFFKYLGPSNYTFYFGNVQFVSSIPLNAHRGWGGYGDKELDWLERKLAMPAELKFNLHHIPSAYFTGREYRYVPWGWKEGYFGRTIGINPENVGYYTQIIEGHERFMDILRKADKKAEVVDLFGHWHTYNENFVYDNILFYHSPSVTPNSVSLLGTLTGGIAGTKEEFSLGLSFRVFRIENNRITFDKCFDQRRLKIERKYENDGTQATITVKNDHDWKAPLNVRMKMNPNNSYGASEGKVKTYGRTDGTCWVRFDADPRTTTVVEISPLP